MTANEKINLKTTQLKVALAELGRRLDDGDESEILCWVITRKLACAHRPLRHHRVYGRETKGRHLPPEAAVAVLSWVKRIREAGIRSVVCLMHPKELAHYAQLDLGAANLIALYQKEGFLVRHIPWNDPAHRPGLTQVTYDHELKRIRIEALQAFDELPKPVLMHCSAGIDRSSPVAAFIYSARTANGGVNVDDQTPT